MPQFLTLREAAALTNKSVSAIRRLISPITKDDQHPDRQYILPSPEEALQRRMKSESFPWQISDDLLRRLVPPERETQKASTAGARGAPQDSGQLLLLLQRELDIKNEQIAKQSELLQRNIELFSGMSERLREGNVLIATLQKQLSPSDGRDHAVKDGIVTSSSAMPPTEMGSDAKGAPAKPGFFSTLFKKHAS